MDKCLHPQKSLIGDAYGIRCTECGRQFRTYQELEADRKTEEEKPKPRKKAASK